MNATLVKPETTSTISTSPTTTITTAVGLGSALLGLAGAVLAAVVKDPNVVHWAGILAGSLFGSTGIGAAVLALIRAAEAETEYAIAVNAPVASVPATTTPAAPVTGDAAYQAAVDAGVKARLTQLAGQ